MKLTVLIRSAKDQTVTDFFEISKDYCTVGRVGDIKLQSPFSSRMHAIFFEDDKGRLCIKDLKSANGIHIGEKRITSTILRLGSRVRIAEHELEIIAFRSEEKFPFARLALKLAVGSDILKGAFK